MPSAPHDTLWSNIQNYPFATLVTVEANGALRSSKLASPHPDCVGNLWFFAASSSAFVANIESSPEVCLIYNDAQQRESISLSGSGLVITNLAIKQEMWNTIAKVWFPDGSPSGGDIVLVRVAVEYAEYWDGSTNSLVRLTNKARKVQSIAHISSHCEVSASKRDSPQSLSASALPVASW